MNDMHKPDCKCKACTKCRAYNQAQLNLFHRDNCGSFHCVCPAINVNQPMGTFDMEMRRFLYSGDNQAWQEVRRGCCNTTEAQYHMHDCVLHGNGLPDDDTDTDTAVQPGCLCHKRPGIQRGDHIDTCVNSPLQWRPKIPNSFVHSADLCADCFVRNNTAGCSKCPKNQVAAHGGRCAPVQTPVPPTVARETVFTRSAMEDACVTRLEQNVLARVLRRVTGNQASQAQSPPARPAQPVSRFGKGTRHVTPVGDGSVGVLFGIPIHIDDRLPDDKIRVKTKNGKHLDVFVNQGNFEEIRDSTASTTKNAVGVKHEWIGYVHFIKKHVQQQIAKVQHMTPNDVLYIEYETGPVSSVHPEGIKPYSVTVTSDYSGTQQDGGN